MTRRKSERGRQWKKVSFLLVTWCLTQKVERNRRWWSRRNKCVLKKRFFLLQSNLECVLNWPVFGLMVATWHRGKEKFGKRSHKCAQAGTSRIHMWNSSMKSHRFRCVFFIILSLNLFLLRLLLLYLYFRHHSALGGYYNINKTPYENQVLKPFLISLLLLL